MEIREPKLNSTLAMLPPYMRLHPYINLDENQKV